MTQEEKAKAYDIVLDKIKRLLGTGSNCSREELEYVFPELKESEDEKIRKNIIATIHLYYGEPLEDEAKEMIAWLEKQCEHAKFRDSIQVGDKVTRNQDGVLVNLSQLKRVAKKDEKQGKNNMGISEATKQKLENNLNKALEKETPESWNKFLDEQGEQKPADKVEPKFHKGEWLCENEPNNYARFIQILEMVNVQGKDRYRISRDIHKDEDVVEFRFVEKYYHKFDIKDAKDGDVLISKYGKPFIYNGKFDSFIIGYYCGITTEGRFDVETEKCKWTGNVNIYPATKEQRDQLENAMADAGYTFDFDKKELKKIEQKPNYCHHEVDLSDCSEEYRKAYYDGWNNCNQQHAQLGAEQNPTWSEEKRKEFIGELQSLMFEWSNKKENMGVCIDRHIDKLLSIVSDISDLKPAWSEEDEDTINHLLAICSGAKRYRQFAGCLQEDITKYQTWLKSLRPQSQWKPSEEQMKALSNAIDKMAMYYGEHYYNNESFSQLKRLLEQLKAL